MTWRMPILGQHDVVEALGQAIDDGHDVIAIGNGQSPARAEIVLHVDRQQQVVRTDVCHFTVLEEGALRTVMQRLGGLKLDVTAL
jgi:hypothetical protein